MTATALYTVTQTDVDADVVLNAATAEDTLPPTVAMAEHDTQGVIQVDVDEVAGGETIEWSTQMDLTQDDLECVLRVERFSAK